MEAQAAEAAAVAPLEDGTDGASQETSATAVTAAAVGAAGGHRGLSAEEEARLQEALSKFRVDMMVMTHAKRNKDKLDGKTARVTKILSRSIKVMFLDGPHTKNQTAFKPEDLTILGPEAAKDGGSGSASSAAGTATAEATKDSGLKEEEEEEEEEAEDGEQLACDLCGPEKQGLRTG